MDDQNKALIEEQLKAVGIELCGSFKICELWSLAVWMDALLEDRELALEKLSEQLSSYGPLSNGSWIVLSKEKELQVETEYAKMVRMIEERSSKVLLCKQDVAEVLYWLMKIKIPMLDISLSNVGLRQGTQSGSSFMWKITMANDGGMSMWHCNLDPLGMLGLRTSLMVNQSQIPQLVELIETVWEVGDEPAVKSKGAVIVSPERLYDPLGPEEGLIWELKRPIRQLDEQGDEPG